MSAIGRLQSSVSLFKPNSPWNSIIPWPQRWPVRWVGLYLISVRCFGSPAPVFVLVWFGKAIRRIWGFSSHISIGILKYSRTSGVVRFQCIISCLQKWCAWKISNKRRASNNKYSEIWQNAKFLAFILVCWGWITYQKLMIRPLIIILPLCGYRVVSRRAHSDCLLLIINNWRHDHKVNIWVF